MAPASSGAQTLPRRPCVRRRRRQSWTAALLALLALATAAAAARPFQDSADEGAERP